MASKMVPKKPLKNESKNEQNKTKNDQKRGGFYYILLYLILYAREAFAVFRWFSWVRNSIAQFAKQIAEITSICLSFNAQKCSPADVFWGQIEVIPTALFGDCTGRISTVG
jgi:hypothetical protein